MYHSGYSSCDKCPVHGEYRNGHVVLRQLDNTKRTDISFELQEDENYHTPLLKLNCGLALCYFRHNKKYYITGLLAHAQNCLRQTPIAYLIGSCQNLFQKKLTENREVWQNLPDIKLQHCVHFFYI